MDKPIPGSEPLRFAFAHNNFNVVNLDKSLQFYREALGLTEIRRREKEGFTLVFLGDGQTAALRIKGHVVLPSGEVPLTVVIPEAVDLMFTPGRVLAAQEGLVQVLVLRADGWFTGLDLATLAAQGAVTIDAGRHDLLHAFRDNLVAGVGVEAALHAADEDHDHEHEHED